MLRKALENNMHNESLIGKICFRHSYHLNSG